MRRFCATGIPIVVLGDWNRLAGCCSRCSGCLFVVFDGGSAAKHLLQDLGDEGGIVAVVGRVVAAEAVVGRQRHRPADTGTGAQHLQIKA